LLVQLNGAVNFVHQIHLNQFIMARHLDLTSVPIPSSISYERGKFGRMFPWLPPCLEDTSHARNEMKKIASTMFDGDNAKNDIPAGYTYLGQFIIHDISFDPTSINERQVDPEFLWNFRTPSIDLDSVYGGGPSVTPYFYDPDPNKNFGMTHFLLPEKPMFFEKDGKKDPAFYDLPRTSSKMETAIIADPRNDENIIISQIHAAFLQFHNAIVDELSKNKEYENRPEYLFRAAQQAVKWHYQWVVLYDYLPRILDLSDWDALMKLVEAKEAAAKDAAAKEKEEKALDTPNKLFRMQIEEIAKGNIDRKFYDWRNEPFVPLEFSVAAFRFGHSQVLARYQFNRDASNGNNGVFSLFENGIDNKRPFARVNFPTFFPKIDKDGFPNKLIEPKLSSILSAMPLNIPSRIDNPLDTVKINEPNLAERNLVRGLMLRLPSGQSVARAMGLKEADIKRINGIKGFPNHLRDNTPLWYYILYEAKKIQHGKRLGPVGSRIVAEVIIGLLQGDKTSFLNQDPNWRPMKVNEDGTITKNKDGTIIKITEDETFNMADLLTLAGVYQGLPPS
jgi:Animal haem peroxidase